MLPISSVFNKRAIVDERVCGSLKSSQDNNQVSMKTVATCHLRACKTMHLLCSFASFKQINIEKSNTNAFLYNNKCSTSDKCY